MQAIVYNFWDDTRKVYDGADEDVRYDLFKDYPYLLGKYGPTADVATLVQDIDHSQMFSAVISSVTLVKSELTVDKTPHAQMYPKDVHLELLKEAASFLSGSEVDEDKLKQALFETDDDRRVAVLAAVGIIPNDENLAALDAVVDVRLQKTEGEDVYFNTVEAFSDAGNGFADIVRRAIKNNTIKTIQFKAGKHSKGTLLAKDPEHGTTLLLKPGAGKQNPALGEAQTPASQSVREAVFYAVASAWDLKENLPECRLLYLDDKEYACLQFLASSWVNGNDLKRLDPNGARRVLSLYNIQGLLHKWAVMDYILGNPDRNAGNVMFRAGEAKLIDHGSALAGIDFQPAIDNRAFVPYYLRVFAGGGFGKMSPEDRLKSLPRLNTENEKKLAEWIKGLNEEALHKILIPYGIDPAPEIARMQLLKFACTVQAADLAVLSVWTIG